MILEKQHLHVRINKDECWNHIHGVINIPDNWLFVPSGDAGLTRSLKTGLYWVVEERPKTKTGRKGAIKVVGLLVPEESLRNIQGKSKNKANYLKARKAKEKKDITVLHEAILQFLNFSSKHTILAEEIAEKASEKSAKTGSGSVGRTKMLSLPEKAELCARAYIRHNYTDYEQSIEDNKRKGAKRMSKTSQKYIRIKREAHKTVNLFLEEHR